LQKLQCPIRVVVQQIAREDRGNIPSFESAMSTIDRERRHHIPEIPTTIAEVDINGKWRLTADRRRFLRKLEHGWDINRQQLVVCYSRIFSANMAKDLAITTNVSINH
jgi:hypothetical protein